MGNCCPSRQTAGGTPNAILLQNVEPAPDNSNKGKVAVAMYDLETEDSTILNFSAGDKLIIVDDSDADWYLAHKVGDDRKGFAPKSYLALDTHVGNEEWFFGDMNRADAERLLHQPENPPGTFMIRDSHIQGIYALSVKEAPTETGAELVRHYKIRALDKGGYFISSSIAFTTLQQLVAYYSKAANGLCCKLERPCQKPRPTMPGPSPQVRDEYEVPFDSLKFLKRLGKGNFGEVFYGTWNGSLEVAIKCIASNGVQSEDFLREIAVMKAIHHPKIVRLYAVCTESEPYCIVMEYMCNGSLELYLRTAQGRQLRLPSLVDMAAQVAEGMKYLESNNLIHRDLAARNILVSAGNIVKLADFGLARVMDEAVYVTRGGKLPIKWTAPEAYLSGEFTIKSDVWSFGIVLYEIFTHGGIPYEGMKNKVVSEVVSKQNYRMPKPEDPECSDAVYHVMLQCWQANPEERPTFDYLGHFFTDFYITSEKAYKEAD